MSENKEPLNKNNKVPKLRFKKYIDSPLVETNLLKIAKINPKCKVLPECFYYIDLESVKDSIISDCSYIEKKNAPSRAQRFLKENDILFSCVRPYQHNNAIFRFDSDKYVASTGFAQIRYKFPFFLLGYFSNSRFSRAVNVRCTGSSYPAINSYDLSVIKIYIPSEEEQLHIGKMVELLNEKIEVIESKLLALKKYKDGLMKCLSSNSTKFETLFKIVSICKKTGLQSSEGLSEGNYKFFINATNDETKWTNTYLFDGEYLILNTGGQAYTNYINDKFSAMSDCLILKPKRNTISIYYWLKANESRINRVGFQGTGLKHLDPSWLMRQKISIIDLDEGRLSKMNEALDKRIDLNNQCLANLKKLKNGLLNSMFI